MEPEARFINETSIAAHRIVRSNGEITVDGLYPEKTKGLHMVRVRITGGRLTLDEAEALADLSDQYADGEWHVDTRQNIELHGVKENDIVPLLEAIEERTSLTTRGSCGDTVRNVVVGSEDYRDRVDSEESSLQAVADEITQRFAGNPEFETLPRKFKIAIYGRHDLEPLHRINDIGFVEEQVTDRSAPLTFSAWFGGGLGRVPRLADLFFRDVPASEAVALVEATVRLYHEHGNRKNRAQARMKWMLKELGAEKVRELILEKWSPPNGVEVVTGFVATENTEEHTMPSSLTPGGVYQQADGRYRVYVPLVAGDLDTSQARLIIQAARSAGARELQCGTRQNIAIPDVEVGREDELVQQLAKIGYAPDGFAGARDVVACPGADQCRKAFVETRNYAQDYAKVIDQVTAPDWSKRIRIGMSGCPNSCTMPQINGLGFRGSVGRVDGQTRQGLDVLLGGRVYGRTDLGREIANFVSHDEVAEITQAAIKLFDELGSADESFDAMLDRVGHAVFERRLKARVDLDYGIWKENENQLAKSIQAEVLVKDEQAIADVSQSLTDKKPREILEWALETFKDKLLMTTALNAGGVLLLRYLKELDIPHPAYFIDTGKHFAETLAYRDQLINDFGFSIQSVGPKFSEADFVAEHGAELFKTDPDLCCMLRKVAPVQELLKEKQAWLSAVRREQGGARAHIEVLERDPTGGLRVNPLAHLTREQIDRELEIYGIPQHPLYAKGYTSIGCEPCTSVGESGSERGGRWPGQVKTECGLHVRNTHSSSQ